MARTRAAAAVVVIAVMSIELDLAPAAALGAPPPADDAVAARQLKLQGFAPVSGTWTDRKGKEIRFIGIAYREEAQGGTQATAKEIRTWGYGTDGRYESMMSLADVRRLTFVQCDDRFGKRDVCAQVESRDGTVHPHEAFRSGFPGGAWLSLIVKTEKGKELSIGLDRGLKDASIVFD